jgi:adenylyl-sulfate kinase
VLTGVPAAQRQAIKGHSPGVVWLTGLSGAGKSTLATALETNLIRRGVHTMLLDGDSLRSGLNSDLGFSTHDRAQNVLRAAQVSSLMVDAGLLVIVAMISPLAQARELARTQLRHTAFLEVYINAPLAVCELRDPKGLYKRVRRGEIGHFTGVDSPYEPPLSPHLELHTDAMSPDQCVDQLVSLLKSHRLLPPD